MYSDCDWTDPEETSQSMPYVPYDDFLAKYNEIYGNNYNFVSDTSKAYGTVYDKNCNNVDFLKNGNYVCWNGT